MRVPDADQSAAYATHIVTVRGTPMFRLRILSFLALLILPATTFAAPTTPSSLLATMCRAEGAVSWRNVQAIASDGTLRSGGLTGNERDLIDIHDGRQRTQERFPSYASASGIDAQGAWRQDRSGQVHPLNSPEAVTFTVTDRWLARRGYCELERLPAALKLLSPITGRGVSDDRVAATPPGGRTVTLWIDRAHYRLARTVMLRSFQTVTTRYSDYHDLQRIELPFRLSTDVGDPAQADVETISRYRLLDSVPVKALQRPDNAVTDARIGGGKKTTLVPFTYGNTKFMVEARINGKGPFPFVLDTGGHAILTPQTAAVLGLKMYGASQSYGAGGGSTASSYTQVDKLQLGDVEIDRQSFLVLPLPNVMTDLGNQPPIAGILGLELFERFAVILDFDKKEMTLQTFATYTSPTGAHATPIRFTDDMPLIEATLDGRRGIFGVDTGNSGPLMLFPQWAARHGLGAYYLAGVPTSNGGQGGQFTTHSAFIRSLRIAGLDVPADEVGELTPEHAGSTSNPSEAGNLGLPVWKHFLVEFNYRRGEMYLKPRAHFILPRQTASAGFAAVKLDRTAFTVVKLIPGGRASKAGLKQRDKIIDVDGVQSSRLASLWLMERINHGKPGTRLHLVCADGRKIDLVLGPDAPMDKALRPSVH